MSTFLQQSFTDTDGTVITSHTGENGVTYMQHPNFLAGTFTIENNRVSKDATASSAVCYASVVSPSLYYEISCSITDKSALNRSLGVFGWMDTASDTMLGIRRQNETTWQFLKIINNVGTTIDTEPATFSAETSHTIALRRIPETNDFEWFLDGVSLGVFTVNDSEFQSIGKVGLRATGGAGGPTVGYHLDNLSATSLTAPRALHRGRHFSFFDDEEVNRSEFWPAITTATVHERAASLSATADIASSGQAFSVFERASGLAATGAITAIGLREVLRSAALNATANIAASGVRIVERSATFTASASVESSGSAFTIFESAAVVNATASIESSAISFSVVESAAAFAATAVVEAVGVRVVDSSASLAATAAIESSATSFSVLSRAAQIDAVAVIESSAESFSVLERQLAITASATITTARQVELSRSAALSAVADIAVTGGVEGGVFEHERSAALGATGAIESAAISFSIIESASALTASASIAISAQRELQRSVTVSATAEIESSGEVSGAVVERAASLAATATISASATFQHPTPARRTFVIESEQRRVTVPVDYRVYAVPVEEREEVAV